MPNVPVAGLPSGGAFGYTITNDPDSDSATHVFAGSGGVLPAGVAVIRKFPFTFATAGLATGHAVYTPTIGDILLDGWIEIDTAWNGTTPKGDFGTFVNVPSSPDYIGQGLLAAFGHSVDMTSADADAQIVGSNGGYGPAGGGLLMGSLAASESLLAQAIQATARAVPAKFTAANPVKVCVSQDGTILGTDPGATQGSAVLYLVTATPI